MKAVHMLSASNDVLWAHINDRNFSPSEEEMELLERMVKRGEQQRVMVLALRRRGLGKYEELPEA